MRVVVLAESAAAADALRRGLRHAPTLRVVGYADSRRPCAPGIAEAHPDLVIVDEGSDRDRTLARIGEVRRGAPQAKVVLLAGTMDPAWLGRASGAGVSAAISSTVSAASFGTLVREIAGGTVFHTFTAAPQQAPAETIDGLTGRELEILRLVARGASNSRIAAQLWVTEQTVKFHLSNTYRKLGVSNRTQASHYAHLHGLLAPTAGTAGPESAAVAA
jgi:DNA-binding NarL/FixJ family response regulator